MVTPPGRCWCIRWMLWRGRFCLPYGYRHPFSAPPSPLIALDHHRLRLLAAAVMLPFQPAMLHPGLLLLMLGGMDPRPTFTRSCCCCCCALLLMLMLGGMDPRPSFTRSCCPLLLVLMQVLMMLQPGRHDTLALLVTMQPGRLDPSPFLCALLLLVVLDPGRPFLRPLLDTVAVSGAA